jgi:putative transposase
MACNVCSVVASNYATLKTQGEKNLVTYKKPKFQYSYNRDYSFLKNEQVSIGTLTKRIKMPFVIKGVEHYFDGTWEFGTATLVHKKGKFYLHISVKKEIEQVKDDEIQNVVGADMGLNFLVTATDSKDRMMFVNGRFMKNKKAQFARVRKTLQMKRTPSARRRLKKIGNRENRWQTDINHQVSKALVKFAGKNSLIVLEDLTGIRKATERIRRCDRYYFVSWAFFQLRQMIEYKAKREGIQVIAVDPKHTSQKCPKCGHTEKANRNKKKHSFCCRSCGYQSNDDRVGAMNLRQMGIEYRHVASSEA